MVSLLDYVVIGLLQGVFEWLPVSSKTIVLLYALYISGTSLLESYLLGLAVQAGTVLSAIAYYRNELFVKRDLFVYRFVLIASLSTMVVGSPLFYLLVNFLNLSINPGLFTLLIGLSLFLLGLLHWRTPKTSGQRREVCLRDAVYMGFAQGLSILPGISRSGITVLALLSRGLSLEDAFKYSFISSIIANLGSLLIALYMKPIDVDLSNHSALTGLVMALAISAVIGYFTIGLLIKLARKYTWRTTILVSVVTVIIGTYALLVH